MDDRRRNGRDLLRRVKARAYLKWYGICLDSPIWVQLPPAVVCWPRRLPVAARGEAGSFSRWWRV
jgi:hypothetical protein